MNARKLLFVLVFLSATGYAQVEKMQAAFLYNFTMLVNWPPSYQTGDFVIAVLGNTPLHQELENMAKQKKAGNQAIVIKKVLGANDEPNAHILYVPHEQKSKISEVLSKTSNSAILVVTESEGAGSLGAVINFVLVENKLRFELNEAKATTKGLKLAANLVKLGIPVK